MLKNIYEILERFDFKKGKIEKYDKLLVLPFLIKLKEKFVSKKYFDKENVKRIINKIKVERVFLRISYSLENYISIKSKDLRLFSGDVLFEYTGSNIFSTDYITLPLCDVFFVCEGNMIILWNHDGHLTVYTFERVKATKI